MSQRRHCCLLVIEDFVVHQSNQTVLFISQISHCCLSVKSDIVVYQSNQTLLFIIQIRNYCLLVVGIISLQILAQDISSTARA